MSADSANIARHLPLMAARQPGRAAVKIPRGRTRSGDIDYLTLTFAELEAEVDAWYAQLIARGLRAGDRTLVMVRPGLPLIAAAFALFRLGAVPVVIDPGMGLRHFLACVARSRPRALLGIPYARLLSRVVRRPFRSVEIRVPASNSMTARLRPLPGTGDRLPEGGKHPLENLSGFRSPVSGLQNSRSTDLAAILFTSGSTGFPKGVCYEHGMFDAQVRLIRETYGIEPGEVDLPMLPIFALFGPALGLTTVVPELDPGRPAAVDPTKIVQAIRQEQVTNSFGSPTLWRKIADHCLAHGLTLPSLRRVLCAGAPVPASLWTDAPRFIPQGRLHSPYGATEVLPVSTVTADAINPAAVRGACVGRPLAENRVKIIALTDGPIATLADVRELPRGEIGEIIVAGPTVTREYDRLPEATALAKIRDGDTVWHRMGDCGYLDAEGVLWFCGRAAERVETADGPMFTEPCEQVFRVHPQVARCALVGLGPRGRQVPAIVVEPKAGTPLRSAGDRQAFAEVLRRLALGHAHTACIRRFYFHPRFPVDVRHNAKIHRHALARWAATRNGVTFRE
ncbi:MAG: fatty acid CoA ligase family protein [Opitutaceae bacterium]|nr:fatty acid CoA ligase family protein [Opitutaceae bacterium]